MLWGLHGRTLTDSLRDLAAKQREDTHTELFSARLVSHYLFGCLVVVEKRQFEEAGVFATIF